MENDGAFTRDIFAEVSSICSVTGCLGWPKSISDAPEGAGFAFKKSAIPAAQRARLRGMAIFVGLMI
jgi:hypothetical protein